MSKNGGRGRSTDIVYDERVSIVLEMLLSGLSRREIFRNIQNSEKLRWDVCEDQIDRYIADAKKIVHAPIREKETNNMISQCFSRYDFLYKRLVNVKDYKGAIGATSKICELIGLNAPIRTINKNDNTDTVIISFKDI